MVTSRNTSRPPTRPLSLSRHENRVGEDPGNEVGSMSGGEGCKRTNV